MPAFCKPPAEFIEWRVARLSSLAGVELLRRNTPASISARRCGFPFSSMRRLLKDTGFLLFASVFWTSPTQEFTRQDRSGGSVIRAGAGWNYDGFRWFRILFATGLEPLSPRDGMALTENYEDDRQ